MAFWWVNHKQTYRQETEGGYVWSPKVTADGRRNVTYDNLARCQAGDVAGPISKEVHSGRCAEAPWLRLQRSVVAER